MCLKNQRHALDGGGVGALAAFDQTLFDQLLRVREQGDALAGSALSAEIIREAFAIGGLREHTRKRVFANTARPRKKQRMRDTPAAKSAAESCDDAIVTEKIGERHALSFLRGGR